MSAVLTPVARRDLGLVAWQVRYEQRAYWRNRIRAVFTTIRWSQVPSCALPSNSLIDRKALRYAD